MVETWWKHGPSGPQRDNYLIFNVCFVIHSAMPSPIVWPLTLIRALGEPSNCNCEGEKTEMSGSLPEYESHV